MPDHNDINAAVTDQLAVGRQFHVPDPCPGHVDWPVMGIAHGRAVAGKVLQCGEKSLGVMGLDEDPGKVGDHAGVVREAPPQPPDDRVRRVHVDIDHRCQIEIEADIAQLPRHPRILPPGIVEVAAGAHRRSTRHAPAGQQLADPLHPTALLVDGDQRRLLAAAIADGSRHLHQSVSAGDIVVEKQHSTSGTRFQLIDHLPEARIGGGAAMKADHDHLADLLAQLC